MTKTLAAMLLMVIQHGSDRDRLNAYPEYIYPPSKYWGGGVVHKIFKHPTSFPESLFFPPPGARERWEEERPGKEVVKHRLCVDLVSF